MLSVSGVMVAGKLRYTREKDFQVSLANLTDFMQWCFVVHLHA